MFLQHSGQQRNKRTLTYKIELPRIALQAYVDIEACKKIITNLINNAVKYADSLSKSGFCLLTATICCFILNSATMVR